METGRAWLVLSLGDEREYAGNKGYADELNSVYRYDSFVPNCRQIAKDDLLIVRDGETVLGTARVSRLVTESGSKDLLRCKICGITTIKERKNKRPRYRCRVGHEFDEPNADHRECTLFAAHFDGTFRPLHEPLPVEQVRPACPRYNGQLAMQEVELARLTGRAKSLIHALSALSMARHGVVLFAADAADEPYVPDGKDERKIIERQLRERRGQQVFREKLRARFGDMCPVTGCVLVDLLEAAHINPYRGEKDNHISNGLLLRTDIHTLFDLDLLGIEPVTLRLHVNPKLKGTEYEQLASKQLECGMPQPSHEALESRWKLFLEQLKQ